MPWIEVPDPSIVEAERISAFAADLVKRAESTQAQAKRELAQFKQLHGLDSGHPDIPDLVKQAPKVDPATRYFEQEMIAHALKSYPGDVRPLKDIEATNEALRADVHKMAPPAPRPLPNAASVFPDSSAELVAFYKQRGLMPVEPELKKAAADFPDDTTFRPGVTPTYRASSDFYGWSDPEKQWHEEEATLTRLLDGIEAQGNPNRINLSTTINLSLDAGTFRSARMLEKISKIRNLGPAVTEKAAGLALRAYHQEANQAGRPPLRHADF